MEYNFQKCSATDPSLAYDHTNFVIFGCIFISVVASLFAIFAKVDLKRTKANLETENEVYVTKL